LFKVKARDTASRQQRACYLVRALFSLEKTAYKSDSGRIVYRSKMHQSLKRNYPIMPGTQWPALSLPHTPAAITIVAVVTDPVLALVRDVLQ